MSDLNPPPLPKTPRRWGKEATAPAVTRLDTLGPHDRHVVGIPGAADQFHCRRQGCSHFAMPSNERHAYEARWAQVRLETEEERLEAEISAEPDEEDDLTPPPRTMEEVLADLREAEAVYWPTKHEHDRAKGVFDAARAKHLDAATRLTDLRDELTAMLKEVGR